MEPAPSTIPPTAEAPGTAWTVDAVLHAFATAGSDLPREAIRWALDHWDVAGPRFLALLERYADGIDHDEATESALFFAVHLLAERRDTRAFRGLCRLLLDADAADTILGDAVTGTLNGVLISTYDGNAGVLKSVVESTTADQFVRAAALEAMCYLTRAGAIADEDMRRYLLHLRAEMRPRSPSFAWTAWCCAVANLGYPEFVTEVERLMSRGFIPSSDIRMDGFHRLLRRTLDDPTGMAGLNDDRIRPFTDTIGTFSTWYGFSEQYKVDQAKRAERRRTEASLERVTGPCVNATRRVGRNDPCPCGSGKKFKKCCLQ